MMAKLPQKSIADMKLTGDTQRFLSFQGLLPRVYYNMEQAPSLYSLVLVCTGRAN